MLVVTFGMFSRPPVTAVPSRDMVCDQDFDPFELPEPGGGEAGDLGSVEATAEMAEAARAQGEDDLADALERRAAILEHITGTFQR